MATVTNTIQNEINHLISGNEIYETYDSRWKYLLEAYLGGETWRQGKHLIRYQLETDGEYESRLNNTFLENHCQSIVNVYKSFLFRNPPVREFGSIANYPELEDFLKDADMDGRSLDAFMKDAATWSSVFGHSWIVISQPNINATTRGEQRENGIRPYVSVLTPQVVLDWQYTRSPNGRYDLVYFKYLEDVNQSIRVVKEWRPESIKTTIVDVDNNSIQDVIEEENQLGMIPVVCLYNVRSTVRGIGISDLADISDAQRFIYNATAEVLESIKLDSHPSIVATSEVNMGSGAGAIIQIPDNLDSGLKPYALEFSGANIESMYKSIEHTIDAIDKMSNTGAVRATESRTLSGVAMEVEFSLLEAKLSEKADAIELAEEQLWKIWCAYMDTTWDGEVNYPGSFNIRDTQKEINQLQTARNSATDTKVIKEIDKEILRWLEVDEDKIESLDAFQPHLMRDPTTGEERIAKTEAEHLQLAAQGWIHPEDNS